MSIVFDLTHVPALQTFPWAAVYEGLARARKTVTTFYGDVHSTQFTHTFDKRWADRDQWRWFNSLCHGVNITGFNVSVTGLPAKYMHFNQHWWARSHEPIWEPTADAAHFVVLREWLQQAGIFETTGRQVFFIQLAGQNSPRHTDFDPAGVPEHLRAPGEFIWLTPPQNPKRLFVNEQPAPWCCWFNHFDWHETLPENNTRWSMRIDGKFTEAFRQAYAS